MRSELWFSGFSPASRIILIESLTESQSTHSKWLFQSRKQDYFNWKIAYPQLVDGGNKFQSRKQDYFNWKSVICQMVAGDGLFQSRKQDYFNWKDDAGLKLYFREMEVSVPQAGLF